MRIDRCHIHHTGEVCLSANWANTRRLYLTNNHIHHGGGHAEGMSLGANIGRHVMSVIARNHIHDCPGDGIEVKQGSWGNLIAENDIHDTQDLCITIYGTAGIPVNVIEHNLCPRSDDNGMQVLGEAIVRDNVIIAAVGAGFASTDHEGKTANLRMVHNTILNTGHAFSSSSWNGRQGLIVANDVLYSREKKCIEFSQRQRGGRHFGQRGRWRWLENRHIPRLGAERFSKSKPGWNEIRCDSNPRSAIRKVRQEIPDRNGFLWKIRRSALERGNILSPDMNGTFPFFAGHWFTVPSGSIRHGKPVPCNFCHDRSCEE